MNWFHRHQWKEIARTFSEPRLIRAREGNFSTDFLERITLGVTTILWECRRPSCCALRSEEMLGRIINNESALAAGNKEKATQ